MRRISRLLRSSREFFLLFSSFSLPGLPRRFVLHFFFTTSCSRLPDQSHIVFPKVVELMFQFNINAMVFEKSGERLKKSK